ncbi:MAG: PLD nuclease N-terminal domain-containing protein [Actinomycetota bacterium]
MPGQQVFMGSLFVFFFLFWLASMALLIWAVIDAATKPDSAWQAADQSKIVWILVALFVPIAGALAYLIAIRPKVRAAGAQLPPPGIPPAP